MKFERLKKIIILASLLFGGMIDISFAQTQDSTEVEIEKEPVKRERFIADEVIAVVGSSMILYSDLQMTEELVEQSYRQRGYTGESAKAEAFETLLSQKLLASFAAKDSLVINEAQVMLQAEQYLASLIEQKGSTAEVEKYFNRPIFSVREYIIERLRESELANTMENTVKREVIMTPSDIVKYYKGIDKDSLGIIPEQYSYSQLTIHTPKTDEAKLNVKEELIGIRERVMNGTKFQTMARMYSEDPGTASSGGELPPARPDTYEAPFAEALQRLKPGQVSDVVETRYGFHLIELISVNDGLYHCRHILLRLKFPIADLERAVSTLDSVANEIREERLTFDLAVVQYSDDETTRVSAGAVPNTYAEAQRGVKAKSLKFFKEELGTEFDALSKLKIGELSHAYITKDDSGNDMVKVVRLDAIIPSHVANLKEDYVILEQMALRIKQEEVYQKWIDDKIAEIYVNVDNRYRNIPIKNKKWYK
ncbi:MAG: peptidylprolyl isomerase [Rikenellaceae bacterium]